jgi:hypothetical protein
MPMLSLPRVVDVTTVDAIVVLVTLVGKLDIPSVSPRMAWVERPWSLIPTSREGLSKIDSKLEIRFLELWVGAAIQLRTILMSLHIDKQRAQKFIGRHSLDAEPSSLLSPSSSMSPSSLLSLSFTA